MHIQNLDVGVKRALVARLKERGEGDAAAETKATLALAAAVAHVHAEVSKPPDPADPRSVAQAQSREIAFKRAFASLKDWAQTNVL